MEQIKILKIVDKYANGECTIRELIGEVKQYCDYHNDQINESTRRIFEVEIENSMMKCFIGEILCEYINAEKDGLQLTDKAIYFKNRSAELLKFVGEHETVIDNLIKRIN